MISRTNCPVCDESSITPYIKTKAQMHFSKEFFNYDQCTNCLFVFLNPIIPPDRLKNYYTNYYLPYRGAKAWGKFEKFVERSQKKLDNKRLKLINKERKLTDSSLILDIGCGIPTFLKTCKDSIGCKTMGIDFSDEGWKNYNEKFKGINLQVADIKDLEGDIHPDVITMWHYLEHDYSPSENLRYLTSISKPSTELVIEVPNFDSVSRKKYGKYWSGWHTPRHISLFSPSNISFLLEKTGWKAKKIYTHGTLNPYLLFWMSEMEKKNIRWDKSMEQEFKGFVAGMIKFLPNKLFEKRLSLGVMTVIARPIDLNSN